MLLDIQESVSELFDSGSPSESDMASLEIVLLGCAEGSHRLAGTRSCLYKLSRIRQLSPRLRRCVESAILRYSQDGRLTHKLSVVGHVINTSAALPEVTFSGTQRVISFPLRWFDKTSRVQPVTVLGENLSDAKVLSRIGEAGPILAGIGRLHISHLFSGGGGSATAYTLDHLANQSAMCVCVVDSDKKSPSGLLGGTASAVQRFKNHTNYPTVAVAVTPGRDLENLLPDSFYEDTYSGHLLYRQLATSLSLLSEGNEHDMRAYIDIEKGIKLFECRADNSAQTDAQFWASKESTLLSLAQADIPCRALSACPKASRRDCTCQLVSGIPADVLLDFVAYAAKKSSFELIKTLNSTIKSEWMRLGMEVASWCCGDAVTRV